MEVGQTRRDDAEVGAIEDLEMAAEEAGEVEAAEGEVEATQKAAEVAAEEG